jgi:L-threonylcarbamoyladenylate synthase
VSQTGDIERASRLLKAGDLVAFPTETVYGLGADASSEQAIARIYALKGRPSNHPVIVHLARAEDISSWARDIPQSAWALARAFWPGPLTMILARASTVPLAVTGGQDSVGLRVPSHPIARQLLQAFGGGIAAPSANRYGRVSPTCADHVREEFGAQTPFILDGGSCEVGLESTIVSLVGPPTLLRPGGISRAQIEEVIGPLAVAVAGQTPRAPGTTESHYAPQTPVRLVAPVALRASVRADAAVLAFGSPPAGHCGPWREGSPEPSRYGHDLYAVLRLLDHSGAPEIVIEEPPDEPEWEAVRDRLKRSAAAYTGADLP